MQNQLGFVLKVLLLSAAISVLIKYAGPLLSIPPTASIATLLVLLPTAILSAIGLWRSQRLHKT